MVYRKTAATEERKEARRRTFLESATRLFGQHGYHAATVPMIVADSGSSTGSFYSYFRNKEDIFAAVLEGLGQSMLQVMVDAESCEPDPVHGTKLVIENLFLWLAENQGEARILIVESSGLNAQLEQVRRGILRRFEDHVSLQLQAEARAYRLDESTIMARCVVGAVFEVVYNWLEEPSETRRPALEVARVVSEYNQRALYGSY